MGNSNAVNKAFNSGINDLKSSLCTIFNHYELYTKLHESTNNSLAYDELTLLRRKNQKQRKGIRINNNTSSNITSANNDNTNNNTNNTNNNLNNNTNNNTNNS